MYRYRYLCRICGESSRFIFQWYYDKDMFKPSSERGVCADFTHMVEIITKDNPYDDLPQRVVDIETQERQYPEILSILERAVSIRTNPEALELFLEQGREALSKIPGLLRKVE